MNKLGFSANAVSKVMKEPDWVQIYSDECNERLANVKQHTFPKEYFIKTIKPLLEGFVGDKPDVDIRKIVQKWMVIFTYKAWALIRVQDIESKDNKIYKEIYKKYADIPNGPQNDDVVKKMTEEEFKNWVEGGAAKSYAYYNYKNILGLFCSELFFAVEAACRVVCIGTCLDFAIKSLLSNIIIQHDEVFKTLKRIGREDSEKISCITCANKEKCKEIPSITNIASLYELCYHIRVIKDYKLEFYWEHNFEEFLKQQYLPEGIKIIYFLESVIDALFCNYLMSPYKLENDKEMMSKLIFS